MPLFYHKSEPYRSDLGLPDGRTLELLIPPAQEAPRS